MINSRRLTRTTALGCAIATLLATLPASSADEPRTLSKIKVAGESEAETYSTDAASTATGLTLSLRETPQSVSVVTRERIQDQAMTSVSDALRNTTGVSVKPVDRGRNNLSVRGFDVNNFQLDGMPVTTGNIGLETTSTAIYERIEIVRGATGLTSGAGDPSAAVNLVRKHADSDVLSGDVSIELGSWEQRLGTLDVSTPLNDDGSVRGRIVASAGSQEAFIDLERKKSLVFYGIVDADLTEATRFSVGASYQRDDRDGVLWAGLPYWYSDGTRTNWSRSSTTATHWNRWDTTDTAAFASLEHRLSDRWSLRGDFSYHEQDEESLLLWLWGDPDSTTGEGMQAWPYHYLSDPRQLHASIAATGLISAFGRDHELVVGLTHNDLEESWSNRDPLDDVAPVGDIREWDGSYPEPALGERYLGSAGATVQKAIHAAARVQLSDAFKVIAGARLSDWERKEEAGAWTAAAYTIEHSSILTTYAGLVYNIGEHLSAYASYTDSFKPQSQRDRNGSYLDPLEGRSYETGLKGEFMDGALNASAAVFRIDQENFAVPDVGFLVPGTIDPAFRTAQGAKTEGYEVEVSGEMLPDWHVIVGWTHFSAKDAEDEDIAVDHARELLRLFTKYRLPGALRALSVGGGVNWEGDRPARAANPGTGIEEKVGQPSYTLIDLMAEYEIREQYSMQLNVNNVLDEKYRSGSYWWGSPLTYGEPREIVLTLRYAF